MLHIYTYLTAVVFSGFASTTATWWSFAFSSKTTRCTWYRHDTNHSCILEIFLIHGWIHEIVTWLRGLEVSLVDSVWEDTKPFEPNSSHGLKGCFFFSRDGVLFGVGLAIRSAKRHDLVKVGSRIQIQLKTRSLRIQLKLHWSQKRSKILALWGSFASASYKNKLWIIRNKVVSGIGRKIMETSWFFAYGSTFWFWFSIFSRLWAIFCELRLRLRFRNFISVAL